MPYSMIPYIPRLAAADQELKEEKERAQRERERENQERLQELDR